MFEVVFFSFVVWDFGFLHAETSENLLLSMKPGYGHGYDTNTKIRLNWKT